MKKNKIKFIINWWRLRDVRKKVKELYRLNKSIHRAIKVVYPELADNQNLDRIALNYGIKRGNMDDDQLREEIIKRMKEQKSTCK